MNKTEFTTELHELSRCMTGEQIEMAISVLNGCRSEISLKNSLDKATLSRRLSSTEPNEAVLRYVKENLEDVGEIKALGASLLTWEDCSQLSAHLPRRGGVYFWWLYDGSLMWGDAIAGRHCASNTYAYVRPVLILQDSLASGLRPREFFRINDEEFRMLSDTVAIRVASLQGLCSYTAQDYGHSMIKYCVDGWYAHLIRTNRKNHGQNES